MPEAKPNSRKKKIVRALMITTVVLGLAIIGLHIWFVNNARSVLKEIVSTKSKGKLKLELSKLSFDFFSNTIEVDEADLASVDTVSQPTTYNIKFRKLSFRVASFWPLLLQKKLRIDSIQLNDPELTVMQWREDTLAARPKNELSIPEEMGKLYNSMLDALDDVGIKRIIITNATLSLVNKMKRGSPPVTVTNIYFNLYRKDNAANRDEYIENEQDVQLRTTRQTINLPGGRHQLAFRNFSLELFRKRIVLDSCTLIARTSATSNSSYEIFFEKLLLIGVDFNAMYRDNLIRADSVYCERPLFDINLSRSDAKPKNDAPPDPGKIVRELTGDLDLAYIGVKDAGIHINITGKNNRELFNSNKDDFEMRGLRINSDSTTPVSVQRFDMLVQDYRLYNEDSSATFSFDSIRFLNNKIVLNNFEVATSSSRKTIHNYRDFKIPYFELTGLDWARLIFDQSLNAQSAVLYHPIINYTKRKASGPKKKTNIYQSMQTLDDLMTLRRLDIVDGQLNLKLGPTAINLKNVNLGLNSDKLLQSKDNAGLRSAFDRLSFSSGVIKLNTITANLSGVRSTGGNLIYADQVTVNSTDKKVKAKMKKVFINNLILDDDIETIIMDGLRWQNANIAIRSMPSGGGSKKSTGSISLRNIVGANTQLQLAAGKTDISTYVSSIRVTSIDKKGSEPLAINGLVVTGSKLAVKGDNMKMQAASYQLASDQPSYMNGVVMNQVKGPDTLSVQSPRVAFAADINSILAKDLHLQDLDVESPVVRVIRRSAVDPADTLKKKPSIRIDRIVAREPVVYIATHRTDSSMVVNIPSSPNSEITITGLEMNESGVQLGGLTAKTNAATITMRNGEVMGVEKGRIDLDVSNIRIGRASGKPTWSGVINNLYLQNPNSFTLGKNRNKLLLEQAAFGNLTLSSEYLADIDQLIKFNVSAWLRTATGQYVDSNTTLKWYNAQYNYGNKTLSLDSFQYNPTKSLDTVLAQAKYQGDYITFKSGAVQLNDFNLEKYRRDSSLIASSVNINQPLITIYRDKQPPFLAGIIKPLPATMIKSLGLPVSVQRVNIINGDLQYTERHAKTRAEGTLFLSKMNGYIGNIKNRNLQESDSLTLVLNASLMDSAMLNLRVRESYLDSLGGFLMTLRMTPTSLSFLNPVLAPLSNVKITSGVIDSFFLRAIGHDVVSIGEMKMYYHGLKIKLVKDGDPDKTSFLGNVASFLANAILIHKNNEGRTGLIFFERLRDRSFFNYIIKMTFSGMATSIGVIKNRKYRKQYERELRERNLPPINFE